ncbi:uncharacterized protein C8Q71DRAFT_724189 [Rhodofomes roseus]|uniref:Yeast cell wall synthesis Kre9/Knh1-like N-terminal domain-containing protein n=1 Tax=Rhodofomes roseus TaxID=34475 RepID=A0ABQ8KFA6_9APHY|nr:uncharacterized protein C8Q71DRAFT_724189 [Rhodofomes roseus]KAH9836406.1 hypothetical protein C8Q71DRAFT_724189 [Rhodofomes roseus]
MKLILGPFSSLLMAVSAANALGLDAPPPDGWTPGETVTEGWQSQPGDPANFTLTLQAFDISQRSYALVAVVETSAGSVTFALPDVSTGEYVLNAVNATNATIVYAQSSSFYLP